MKNVKSPAVFIFLIVALALKSQSGFLVGLEGGAGPARMRGNDFIKQYHTNRTGYTAGLFAQYNFKEIISLRSGVYYDVKGSTYHANMVYTPGVYFNGKAQIGFNYLTIPLLLRAGFGKKLKCFVNAGPYLGVLLKETEHTYPNAYYPAADANNTERYKKTETGVLAGLGVSYTFGRLLLSLEARGSMGLTNISALPVINAQSVKTGAANALLGIAYKLKINKPTEPAQK